MIPMDSINMGSSELIDSIYTNGGSLSINQSIRPVYYTTGGIDGYTTSDTGVNAGIGNYPATSTPTPTPTPISSINPVATSTLNPKTIASALVSGNYAKPQTQAQTQIAVKDECKVCYLKYILIAVVGYFIYKKLKS